VSVIIGQWHDGHSSAAVPARLEGWPQLNHVRMAGAGFERDYALDAVRVSSRVGNISRRLELPDGSCFATQDNDAVDALFHHAGGRALLAHWLESHWAWVSGALLATVVAVWAAVAWGIPYLAEQVARAIPVELEARMGEQTLQALDKLAFAPSQLSAPQQTRGRRLLSALAGRGQRLEFRAMGHGIANAFALPSGIIVVTDRLAELADNDEELQAVFAHELGHVYYRHSLRTWLQNSATALLTAAVLGDVNSIAANVAVLPTLLLENQYSHAFEEQADDFAAQTLEKTGVNPCHLGVILRKMETSQSGGGEDVPDFLSTHPATEKRVRRLDTGKGACL